MTSDDRINIRQTRLTEEENENLYEVIDETLLSNIFQPSTFKTQNDNSYLNVK